ncbi:hypothetical protein MNV49_001732 [Pseudohyphozyma bogoriensis]|nr:hypothetical protein MNV49_001732 [Pseudohyphozyma bogoriensis]
MPSSPVRHHLHLSRDGDDDGRESTPGSTTDESDNPAYSPIIQQPVLSNGVHGHYSSSSTSDVDTSSEDEHEEIITPPGNTPTLHSPPFGGGRRRGTTITPFSRPPSAVTVAPSRPSSSVPAAAAPTSLSERTASGASGSAEVLRSTSSGGRSVNGVNGATVRVRKLSKRSAATPGAIARGASSTGSPPRGSPPSPTVALPFERGVRSSTSPDKGKGKAVASPPSPAFDPLDPLSSFGTTSSTSTSPPSSYSRRTANGINPSLPRPLPPSTSIAFPPASASTSASPPTNPTPNSPTSLPPSTSATTSSDEPIAATQPPQQQSLQEILQAVDLSAALRLVQTLQSTQLAQPSPPTTSPLPPPPSISTAAAFHTPNSQAPDIAPISTPSLHPSQPGTPVAELPTSPHLESLKTERRRSLSLGFGLGKRERVQSVGSLSQSGSAGGGAAVPDKGVRRVPDERAALGGAGRSFEEQISKVHLHLSPATMRRAKNAERYLVMRYETTPGTAPNLLEVARWREEKEERERKLRRALMGTSGRMKGISIGSKEDLGESDESLRRSRKGSLLGLGGAGKRNDVGYGPRRNKYPKVWEIYPEDIGEWEEDKRKSAPGPSGMNGNGVHRPNGMGNGWGKPPTSPSSASASASASAGATKTGSPAASVTSVRNANSSSSSHARPGLVSRENSFDRSSLMRGRSSMDTSASGGAVGLGLKRVSSLGSATGVPPGTSGSPRSPLGRAQSQEGGLSRVFSNSNEASPTQGQHSPKQSRSGLGRRLDKIRGRKSTTENGSATGTDLDGHSASDFGFGFLRKEKSGERDENGRSPDPSDAEFGGAAIGAGVATVKPSGVSRRPSHVRVLSGLSDASAGVASARNKLRRTKMSTTEDGYKSSGGEGKRGRGALWGALSGGLRRTAESGGEMGEASRDRGASSRSRIRERRVWVDESEDEEEKPQREVVDLNDEDFIRLNSVLRQLRGQLSHVETFLPRIPHSINSYLDQITHLETTTLSDFSLPVHYAFPRLGGTIVAELARAKEFEYSNGDSTDSSSIVTSDEDSDDESDEPLESSVTALGRKTTITHETSRRRDLSQSRSPTRINHSRRVTDPIRRQAAATRSRASTIAAGVPRRGMTLPETRRDPLDGLGRALSELDGTTRDVDDEVGRLTRAQERVGRDIGEVVKGVDEVQKAIDATHFQKLRMLEDHYFRLRSSVTRPSTTVDTLWALLSYVIVVFFWASWFVISAIRHVRNVLAIPIIIFRWLFFLR